MQKWTIQALGLIFGDAQELGKALESCRLDLFALFDEPSGINPFLTPLLSQILFILWLVFVWHVASVLYHIVCYSTILSVCASRILSGTSFILLLYTLYEVIVFHNMTV